MDYRKLPEGFLEKMRCLLGSSYGEYLDSFLEPPFFGLRVNTLKMDAEAFYEMARAAGWDLSPVPWTANGFYCRQESRPARHPWYFAGLYYLQEPSAMAPASLLPVGPGDRVLDLCAAPGGKSTELAARLGDSGFLLSNDISHSRAMALLKNLELSGAGNFCVSSEAPEKLACYFPEFFDKILVDAPCSGEGMFRRDPEMAKSYRERGPEYYVPLQQKIMSEAVKMLAPGGLLLYSTCTFDEGENEGTVRYVLEHFPEMGLLELPKRDGFLPGEGLAECVRLFPHRVKGEGHFAALFGKKGEKEADGPEDGNGKNRYGKQGNKNAAFSMEPVLDFLGHIDRKWKPERFYGAGDRVFYLPEVFSGKASGRSSGTPARGRGLLGGLRYLRTGLFLGEMKKGRFEPSQALAMNLKAREFDRCLELFSEDSRVIRYLKGETLSLTEKECGGAAKQGEKSSWRLICVDGHPLGWGRIQGHMLKNKYYPGWRWQ